MSAARLDVWIFVEHLRGVIAGQTYELLGKGREIAGALGGRLMAVLIGNHVQPLAQTLGAADSVLCVENERLENFTPEGYALVLHALAEHGAPRLILFGATSMGIDLASLLAAALESPLIVNCRNIRIEDSRVVVINQMCGGKLLCEAEVIAEPAVLTAVPGAFPAEAGVSDRAPAVESIPLPVSLESLRTRVTRLIEPEPGDVDITKAPILVAVGRGIQRKENLPLAEDLARALGGTVCSSRPVVDQGWLPVSRQVGKSGMTVKPKLYLALGISGAPEHAEGMKDAELVIAVNLDPKAPIFDIADYGAVVDLFELLPPLAAEAEKRRVLR